MSDCFVLRMRSLLPRPLRFSKQKSGKTEVRSACNIVEPRVALFVVANGRIATILFYLFYFILFYFIIIFFFFGGGGGNSPFHG